MNIEPLHDLIVNRGFDRYQDGLKARFDAFRLNYSLVYGEPTDKASMYMDFESETQIGRITVWVSGECDMEVLNKSSGERVFDKVHQFKTEEDFFEEYPKLVLYMSKLKMHDNAHLF